MGCDIHAMMEKKGRYGYWKNAGDPDIGRDYEMFAVLAGVRNDNDIEPISPPKGLPDDASGAFEGWFAAWGSDAHSASYLTLKELKEANLDQEFDDESLILAKDKDGKIIETCAATSGKYLGKVGHRKLFELWGRKRWDELLDKLESLKDPEHTDEDVRVVFFFDN